jgi:phosphatidylinositol alpha-mannosyltransferase
LGFVDEPEKLKLLKGCTVFVSPALYGESFGIVLIEAMAMGAPVVAGNNTGYATVLRGYGGLGLVHPKETKEFADRLHSLLSDSRLTKKLSDWGLKEVKLYSYTRVVAMYEKLYEGLIK